MTIGAAGMPTTAAPAAVVPARIPTPGDPNEPRTLLPPIRPNQSKEPVLADQQAAADPLRPTARDGWSPDRIVAVKSRHDGGILGAALNFTLGGVDEQPGQRLSHAQVDALAPFYATQFGLDEGYVRRELAKVYLYVGGPSVDAQAMTIGHHVFVPDEQSLTTMLSPRGKRWLVHELAHTMQYLAYHGDNPQRFLADYVTSMVVARDPQQPGRGDGPAVWGAFFTGLGMTGKPEDEIGKGSTSVREALTATVLPATAVSLPVALVAGGAIKAARATTGRQVLGTGSASGMALTAIFTPALVGSAIGLAHEKVGDGWTKTLATVAGGTLAGLALWRGGAFSVGGSSAVTEVGRTLGRTSAIGLAIAGTLGGAAVGLLSATASANTMRGWSSSAHVLHDLHRRAPGTDAEKLDLQQALHDSHYMEIDAEAIARRYAYDWDRPAAGSPPVTGRTPVGPDGLVERIDSDFKDWMDWGVKVPLVVGVPAAVGVGAGVLASRAGVKMVRTTFTEGRPFGEALSEAMLLLGNNRQGIRNSLAVGASLTIAPLMAGGLAAPAVYQFTGSETVSRLAGAGAGAAVTGALLTLLLKGRGGTLVSTSAKVGIGAAVAGAIGFMAGGVATEALRPHTREYDVAGWRRATGS